MAVPKQQPPSYTGNPPSIPGKLITEAWPTPFLDDRILVLRKDLRKFPRLPRKGSRYSGPNCEKFKHFRFATAKPNDQVGWVNLYYINERQNQDQYNFEITYPYASKDYPTVTRTYVFLRGDQRGKEPDADSKDPVYGDLSLTDHKVIRLQQLELDALFVGIQRVYERLPGPIITSFQMNDVQQEVTVNEQEDIAPPFPNISALFESAKVERKTTAKALVTSGTVPEVFPASEFRLGGEDPINPYRFRRFAVRLPALVVSQTQAGQAQELFTLPAGEFGHVEQQTTKFKKRVTANTRPLPVSLPVTLIEYRLTPEQQLSTVTETFDVVTQPLVPQPLLIEGEMSDLGNGQTILNRVTIPNVFPKATFEVEKPDPVPEKWRVTIPVLSTSETSIGTAVPPVLAIGDLGKKDEQTTEFWHRTTLRHRDQAVLPASLINYRMTEQHQLATVIETLAEGAIQSVAGDIGITTVEANVENLGKTADPSTYLTLKKVGTVPSLFTEARYEISRPEGVWPERFRALVPDTTTAGLTGGTAGYPVMLIGDMRRSERQMKAGIKETSVTTRITNYPTPYLYGQEYDQTLDVVVPYEERVEAVGFTPIGTNRVDIFPQGDGTQRIKTVNIAQIQAALNNYLISFASTGNLELPDVLVSITGLLAGSAGDGNTVETGSAIFFNRGSATTDIHNNAEANAVIIPEVQVQILQVWARNIPITHYLFFLPIPVHINDVVTKLTALLGQPVHAWPKWCPVVHNLSLVGESVDLNVKASSMVHIGGDSCNPDCSASQSAASGGTGYSQKQGLTIKTVHIPPTIHGPITLLGQTQDQTTVSASTSANVNGNLFEITRSATILAGISPTKLPATPSDNFIPTSGLHVHKIDSEPYRWGYAKVHAEVVNFADLVVGPGGVPTPGPTPTGAKFFARLRVRFNSAEVSGASIDADFIEILNGATRQVGLCYDFGSGRWVLRVLGIPIFAVPMTITAGTWYEVWLGLSSNPAASTIAQVYIDGTQIINLTNTPFAVGTTINTIYSGVYGYTTGTDINRTLFGVELSKTGFGATDIFNGNLSGSFIPPFDSQIISAGMTMTLTSSIYQNVAKGSANGDAFLIKAFPAITF